MQKYNIHNIVTIESSLELFPRPFVVQNFEFEPDLSIKIKSNDYFLNMRKGLFEIMPGIFTDENRNTMFSEFPFFGFKCFLFVSGLSGTGKIKVAFNSYLCWVTRHIVRMPVSSLFPLEHFLKLLLARILESKGASMLFCAALRLDDFCFLISSYGSMGKTSLVLNLKNIYQNRLSVLGDDTCIAFKNKIYSYPQDVRIRGVGSKFFHIEKFVDPRIIFGDGIINSFTPNQMIFLERAEEKGFEQLSLQRSEFQFNAIQKKTLPVGFERHTSALLYLSTILSSKIGYNNFHSVMSSCKFSLFRGTSKNYIELVHELITKN